MEQLQRHHPRKVEEIVHELMVRDVMTKEVITVAGDARVRDLRELLRSHRISGVPVVDSGRLVGIISLEDFIKCLAERENGCRVAEKMTREVVTLFVDDPLVRAVARFEASGVGRLPVVERRSNRLVGIVTKGDVIRGLLRKLEIEYHEEEVRLYRASHIFEDLDADSTTLSFQYLVPGQDFDRAGAASSRLKRTLHCLGLVPELVRRVAIASYEAEMNLAIFTAGGRIAMRVRPRRVFLEIEDSGPGIADVEKAMEPGFSTASDEIRELGFGAGMGLPNIHRMSERLSVDSRAGRGTKLEVFFKERDAT